MTIEEAILYKIIDMDDSYITLERIEDNEDNEINHNSKISIIAIESLLYDLRYGFAKAYIASPKDHKDANEFFKNKIKRSNCAELS